jgi:hypothetical protein
MMVPFEELFEIPDLRWVQRKLPFNENGEDFPRASFAFFWDCPSYSKQLIKCSNLTSDYRKGVLNIISEENFGDWLVQNSHYEESIVQKFRNYGGAYFGPLMR